MMMIGPCRRRLQRAANAVLSQAKHGRVRCIAAFKRWRHEAGKVKSRWKEAFTRKLGEYILSGSEY